MNALKLLAASVLFAAGTGAIAQGYPSKPVTVIVPFPPGGSSDTVARAMQAKLVEGLGQPVIIDNKPGANGSIGAGQVAHAKPDGYTLLVSSIGTYAINPALYKELPYDPMKDFDLLTVAVRTPNALVINPGIPAKTAAEFIAYLKKNPDKVSFASSGAGSSDHLSAEAFWQKTGTTGIHVPFKGGGLAINDLIAGHADASFQNLAVVSNHIKAGKLRLLAVTSDKRVRDFPQAPTMKEAGVAGMEIYSWQAVAAPKGLPQDVAAKLQSSLLKTLNDPTVVKRLDEMGFEVVANSSADFSKFLAVEIARWKAVVAAGNVKVD